jgi:hypothetical protein
MAAGTRQTNTMDEILRKQLAAFSDLKLADDADFDWIAEQEAKIIEKLRGPQDKARAIMEAQQTTAVTPQMGGPMGGQPATAPAGDPNMDLIMQAMQQQGGMPPSPGAVPGAMPPGRGPTQSAPMPNPDELRRVMGQGQGMQ